MPAQPLLALGYLVGKLGVGLALGQLDVEIRGPERGEGGERQFAEAELTLAGAAHDVELTAGFERALLVEGGGEHEGVGAARGGGEGRQLQVEPTQGQGGHPAGAALLAAVLIGDVTLLCRQLVDLHHQGGTAVGGRGVTWREQAGQRFGQVETDGFALIRQPHQIDGWLDEARLVEDQGALAPAFPNQGGELQALEGDEGLLLVIEQSGGADGEGGVAQADVDLPQVQVQAVVFGQPARQVALGQRGGLP